MRITENQLRQVVRKLVKEQVQPLEGTDQFFGPDVAQCASCGKHFSPNDMDFEGPTSEMGQKYCNDCSWAVKDDDECALCGAECGQEELDSNGGICHNCNIQDEENDAYFM